MPVVTLKALRERAGLTQEKAAHAAALSLKTVINLETGRLANPTFSTINAIARAYGCSAETLVSALAETIAEAA